MAQAPNTPGKRRVSTPFRDIINLSPPKTSKKTKVEETPTARGILFEAHEDIEVVAGDAENSPASEAAEESEDEESTDYETATSTNKESFDSPLHAWLISHGLGRHYRAIRKLGARRIADLGYMTKSAPILPAPAFS